MKGFGPYETDKLLDPEDKFTGDKIKNMLVHDFFEGRTDDNIANETDDNINIAEYVRKYNENAKKIYLLDNKGKVLDHIKKTFLIRIENTRIVINDFLNNIKVSNGTIEASIVSELKLVIKKDLENISNCLDKEELKKEIYQCTFILNNLKDKKSVIESAESLQSINYALENFPAICRYLSNHLDIKLCFPELSSNKGTDKVAELKDENEYLLERIRNYERIKKEKLEKKSIYAMNENNSLNEDSLFGLLKRIALENEKKIKEIEEQMIKKQNIEDQEIIEELKRQEEQKRIEAIQEEETKDSLFEEIYGEKSDEEDVFEDIKKHEDNLINKNKNKEFRSKSENRVPKQSNSPTQNCIKLYTSKGKGEIKKIMLVHDASDSKTV